jgi:outer membrane protein assembly factor BamB
MSLKSRLLAPLFAALIASPALADWPQWRGPERNDQIADFKAPAVWPKELTQKWKVPIGIGDSSPILATGKIYATGRIEPNEVTLCLDAATGKEIWRDQFAASPAPTGPDKAHSGPRSTPTAVDGKLVVAGVSGMLTCFDAATGKILWRKDEFFKLAPPVYSSVSPLVSDGLVVAQLGNAANGGIFAYDLATGEQKWKWSGEGQGYASPSLLTVDGGKQIVAETDKNIVGLGQADGKLLWQIPWDGKSSFNAPSPVVTGTTVIFTAQNRGITAVKIEKAGDAYATKQLWKNATTAAQFCTPVIKDNLLYGISDRGTFFCLKADSGQAVWADTTRRGGNHGAVLDAGAVMLALTNDSQLVVFKPGEKYEELAKIKVAATPITAHPVITGSQVFVRDADSVALLSIE